MRSEMDIVREGAKRIPVDVVSIIEELGIVYIEEPMVDGSSGRIDYHDPFCTITVNSEEGPQRRRFTAAHELGHYLLHRDLLGDGGHLDRLYADGGEHNPYAPLSPAHEVQANRFAADLLMPSSVLRDMYDLVSDNVNHLAQQFDVSVAAMKIRLQSLGIRNND